MKRIALLALLASSCASDLHGSNMLLNADPGMLEYVQSVWDEYGGSGFPGWNFYLVYKDQLDCPPGSWHSDGDGECVDGDTIPAFRSIQIAWPDGMSIEQSSVRHELCHAYMFDTTGDGHPRHDAWCFQ